MNVSQSILGVIGLLALAGCVGQPDLGYDDAYEITQTETTEEYYAWWQELNDPLLNQLVQSGRQSGLDIRIARTQIDEANAFSRSQFARLFPELSLTANSDLLELPDGAAGLSANWEIDIFGSIRASVRAARLRGRASEETVKDVRRLISSQIVALYIQLRARQVEYSLAEQSAARVSEGLSRLQRLSNAGHATRLDVTRSAGQLTDVLARLEALKGQERALQNSLRALVGEDVDFDALYTRTVDEDFLFSQPDIIDADPDTFFVNRPDIRAAALFLNAEGYEKLSARRSLYPNINLQGSGLYANSSTPLSTSGISTSLIGSLVFPLLGRGRILSQIDAEDAQLERAAAEYEQTVLNAALEVDTGRMQVKSNRAAALQQREGRALAPLPFPGPST